LDAGNQEFIMKFEEFKMIWKVPPLTLSELLVTLPNGKWHPV